MCEKKMAISYPIPSHDKGPNKTRLGADAVRHLPNQVLQHQLGPRHRLRQLLLPRPLVPLAHLGSVCVYAYGMNGCG